jgi:hypothetical protein
VPSRTPAPSQALFQIVTGLKLPGLLGLQATPVAIASQSARCVAASNVVGVDQVRTSRFIRISQAR